MTAGRTESLGGPRYRWFIAGVLFLLLHQSDRLPIGPLTARIMATFGINEIQMELVFSGALVVQVILYPLWCYLYDRFARPSHPSWPVGWPPDRASVQPSR